MKRFISCLLLTFALSNAYAEEQPSVAEVYEFYHYCLYEIETDDDSPEYETEILSCVNQELTDAEYSTFSSFAELMSYTRAYLDGDDDS